MLQDQLASRLLQLSLFPPVQFQQELINIIEQPTLLHLLAQIIASDLPHNQKLMAATGINLVVRCRINNNNYQQRNIWNQFSQKVLGHRQAEVMQWRHLRVIFRSVQLLMEDFQEDFFDYFVPIFMSGCLKVKNLLLEAFIQADNTPETKYLVLQRTSQNLFKEVLSFILWFHQNQEKGQDNFILEQSIMENIDSLFSSLEDYQYDQNIARQMAQISQNEDLIRIIEEELQFDFDSGKRSRISLYSRCNDQRLREHSNHIKARIIKICKTLANHYHRQSMVSMIDISQLKHLQIIKNMISLAMTQLPQLTQHKHLEEGEISVVTALLQLLNIGAQIIFMAQFFQQNLNNIFFDICYRWLQLDSQEKQQYEGEGLRFIRITQQLVRQEEFMEDREENIKNQVSNLLKVLATSVNGSLGFMVRLCIKSIRHLLGSQEEKEINMAMSQFRCHFTVQTSLSILTILSVNYSQREDILEQIRIYLLGQPWLLQLKDLPLAKLLLFLSYNYRNVYSHQEQQGYKYLNIASSLLSRSDVLGQCALRLFSCCISLTVETKILECLLQTVDKVGSRHSLTALERVIAQKKDQLPKIFFEDLVLVVIGRVSNQYKYCQQANRQIQKQVAAQMQFQQVQMQLPPSNQEVSMPNVRANCHLIQCFNILEQVCQNTILLRQDKVIIEKIWPLFELFHQSQTIQFQDNILKIFLKVMRVDDYLFTPFYSYLDTFPIILYKHQTFKDDLLQVYSLLLSKGKNHFLVDGCHKDLRRVLESLKKCYSGMKKEGNLMHLCIFFHYAYSCYSEILQRDETFFSKLYEIFIQERQTFEKNTIAVIISLFLISQAHFGCQYASIVHEYPVETFRNYQADMVIVSFHHIVQQHYKSDRIIEYLKYALRLLYSLHKSGHNKQGSLRPYYQQVFQLHSVDPFAQIRQTFTFLRERLQPQRFNQIMEQVQFEVNLSQINNLLSLIQVQNGMRKILTVRDKGH